MSNTSSAAWAAFLAGIAVGLILTAVWSIGGNHGDTQVINETPIVSLCRNDDGHFLQGHKISHDCEWFEIGEPVEVVKNLAGR